MDLFDLQRLDISAAQDTDHVLVLGKRATGKTSLARHIVETACAGIPVGMVATNSPEPYASLKPPPEVLDHYEAIDVGLFIEAQKHPQKADPRAYIVFDSCFYDPGWSDLWYMKHLLGNNKTLHSKTVITLQYPQKYAHMDTLDYVFMFGETNPSYMRNLYDLYGQKAFPDYDTFEAMLDKYTSDPYNSLVVRRPFCDDASVFCYSFEL